MIFKDSEVINNVYEVDRFLGEGAFAEVYRVKHKFLGRQAMKVFKSADLHLAEVERDLSEAVLLSKIGHPNIIRVFDAGILKTSIGSRGFFTMEYVPGGTLDLFWRSHKSRLVPIADTINIIKQVCMGLAVGHSKTPPIIHRDIKPQNILVGFDGDGLRIKISDFGLAKTANPLTMLASAKGTPAFKPPESFDNIDSRASDIWATGVILYLLLTDRFPFVIDDNINLIKKKDSKQTLILPSEFNPRVDGLIDSITAQALNIDPSKRYPSALEMLQDLLKWSPQMKVDSQEGRSFVEKRFAGNSNKSEDQSPENLVRKAFDLSKDVSRLNEAADTLEEALTRKSSLREKYEYQLKLWRRGIIT
jgi:serine/threonine protein kinase